MELRYVNPAKLHDAWEVIKDGLLTCIESDDDDVWPEDVYACIKQGIATLHLGYEDGNYVGFSIIMQQADPWSGEPRLHIWFVNGTMAQSKEFMEEMVKMAKSINANKITFESPRRGLEKLGLGFEVAQMTYMMRIE